MGRLRGRQLGTGNTGTEGAGSGRRVVKGKNTEAFLVSPEARRKGSSDIRATVGECPWPISPGSFEKSVVREGGAFRHLEQGMDTNRAGFLGVLEEKEQCRMSLP